MKEAQIVLTVTALVLFLLESAEAQIPPAAQVKALNDLTKHWPTLTLAADVCSTEWLSCDNRNVITLKLKGRGLNGSIPEFVGDLTGLTELRLDGNDLGGSIPEFLGKLTSLDLLRLSTNQFTGTIPESLRNLKKLRYLYLDDNYLTGSIPESLGNLTSLLLLSLRNNRLEGSIPASLGNLQNLTDLYLEKNKLSGSIPESLGNPKGLDRLYLNDNDLVGSIPGSLLRRPPARVFNTTNNCLLGAPLQRDDCPSGPSPAPPAAASRGKRPWVLPVAVSAPSLLVLIVIASALWKKNLTQGPQQLPEPSVKHGKLLVEGVWCLYEPNPALLGQFDIVLFPGPNTAWSTRDGSVPCWPMEWLPEKFPEARLLMVEFPTGLSLWESAINHAQALGGASVNVGTRPYFLVGHSVGGVLAKEVLLRAVSENQEVVNMCKGIVFYGVPQLEELPVKCELFGIAESEMYQFDKTNALKLYLNFQPLQRNFRTWYFIERQKTTIRGRKMMVSANSQAINADASRLTFIGDADHFKVCMPKTREDLIVHMLVNFIKSTNVPQR